MQWSVVVLWLMSEAALPTRTGTLLEARQTFPTAAECVRALPGYRQQVERDFHAEGVVVCVEKSGAQAAHPITP